MRWVADTCTTHGWCSCPVLRLLGEHGESLGEVYATGSDKRINGRMALLEAKVRRARGEKAHLDALASDREIRA